jgi:hypothetical protein
MNMRRGIVFFTALLLLSAALVSAQTGSDLFQQAQKKIYEERDFAGAIQIYDRILREFASDRALAGKAAIGRVRAKELIVRAEARKDYEDVIRTNADLSLVEAARNRLEQAALPVPGYGIYIAAFDQVAGKVRGPVERLTDWETQQGDVAFSSDGKWIISLRRGPPEDASLVIRSLETERETNVQLSRLQAGRNPSSTRIAWLKDEGVLVFTNGVLFLVDPLGAIQKLSSIALSAGGPRGNMPGEPFTLATSDLSPDGKILYLIQTVRLTDSKDLFTSSVVAFDVRTGQRQQAFRLPVIPQTKPTNNGPIVPIRVIAVSPDSQTIAILERFNGPDARISVVGVNGDDYRILARDDEPKRSVAWTADGRYIVFGKKAPGNNDQWRVMRVAAEGGEPEFTGLEVTGLLYLAVSPDGSRIAFDGMGYTVSEKNDTTRGK